MLQFVVIMVQPRPWVCRTPFSSSQELFNKEGILRGAVPGKAVHHFLLGLQKAEREIFTDLSHIGKLTASF